MVCLVGMPGAGKSTISQGLKEKGYPVVNMGDAIRAEAKRRGVEPTRKNLTSIMLEIRQRNGPGAVAHLIKPHVLAESGTVIIDGARSSHEIDVLRECGELKLLAIHASSKTRFGYLSKRRRTDDPNTNEQMRNRDRQELDVGISDPIALADESISNNSITKTQLVDTAFGIVQDWRV